MSVYVLRVCMCLLCESMFMQLAWVCVHVCVYVQNLGKEICKCSKPSVSS